MITIHIVIFVLGLFLGAAVVWVWFYGKTMPKQNPEAMKSGNLQQKK